MLNRRAFVRLATAGAVATAAAPAVIAHSAQPRLPLLKPKRLKEGDTVGLVLPASLSFEAGDIARAKEQLEAIGFQVKVGQHAYARQASFAGTDRQRAADLNAMFADPAINGISCFTGGWGTPRILPYLDYELIRKNPKVLIGYSDITALINSVQMKTGLVTFHGPVADSRMEPYTLGNFRRVVMSAEPIGTLANPPKRDEDLINREHRVVTIRGGRAKGRIVGGNLTLIASTMGTPYEIDTNGALLFLEDVDEKLYRVDRMLTQLWLAGKFEKIAGFAFGRCTECPAGGPSLSLGEILEERFGALGVPAISGLAFGHIEKKLTLPLGLEGTLDADAGTLTIAESAVL
jgi:muramoyltetrapeptide carboxypeptidase